MLYKLNIQGLAIIESLEIEFSPGFNVITGETGAGKSILIKALGLLLGAKASAETVRHGRESATIVGFFEVPKNHRALQVLESHGIPFEDLSCDINGLSEGELTNLPVNLLVRRVVTHKGRSLAWVNDIPVTNVVLKELAVTLIDMFGQHDNLKLLDPAQHLLCLDQFLSEDQCQPDIRKSYEARYLEIQGKIKEFYALLVRFRTGQRDADYIGFRCREINSFGPCPEEYVTISEQVKALQHNLQLVKVLEKAVDILERGGADISISAAMWEVCRQLGQLATISAFGATASEQTESDEFSAWVQIATRLAHDVDDLSFSLGKALRNLESNEHDLEALQSRLAGYQALFRKFNVATIEHLMEEVARFEAERQWGECAAIDLATILDDIHNHLESLKILGARLTSARNQARVVVKRRLESELQMLAMPGAQIEVELLPSKGSAPNLDLTGLEISLAQKYHEVFSAWARYGESGLEKAQFLLASNPGEPFWPLQKIASGGEISRVMLAMKKALAVGADSCILVFDEIDAGISGRVADVVGRKMQELSQEFQVICISHLAQVAAYSETHFLVKKFGKGDRTESTIIPLSNKESEQEIARLVSGSEVTTPSLANAKALLRKARQHRKTLDQSK